jgi:hypothetical protein
MREGTGAQPAFVGVGGMFGQGGGTEFPRAPSEFRLGALYLARTQANFTPPTRHDRFAELHTIFIF